MEIVIASPFGAGLSLILIGIGIAVGGYGIVWRGLLKPRFDAQKAQAEATTAALEAKQQTIQYLDKRVDEFKHSEAAALIDILRQSIAEKDSSIESMRSRLDRLSEQEKRQTQLRSELDNLREERERYRLKLAELESGRIELRPSQHQYTTGGLRILATNILEVPIRVRGHVEAVGGGDIQAFEMLLPAGESVDTTAVQGRKEAREDHAV